MVFRDALVGRRFGDLGGFERRGHGPILASPRTAPYSNDVETDRWGSRSRTAIV